MTGEPKMRGKVNVVLNGLVRKGVIAGFKTNLGFGNGGGTPLVTVTAPEGQSPHAVRALVVDALANVVVGINVTTEPT